MAKKKTRTIMCLTEEFEKEVYRWCDKYNIKNKNIATSTSDGKIYISIYSSSKKFDNIAFKLGGLAKFYM